MYPIDLLKVSDLCITPERMLTIQDTDAGGQSNAGRDIHRPW